MEAVRAAWKAIHRAARLAHPIDSEAVAIAGRKGISADAGGRVGDRDAHEAAARLKGGDADAGDRVGDRDVREAAAMRKGEFADAGDV